MSLGYTFLQELNALEIEVRTLLRYAESPEQCPELYSTLNSSIKRRISQLVVIFYEMVTISNSLVLPKAGGAPGETSPSFPIVTDFTCLSLINFLHKLVTSNSDNLAFTKDLVEAMFGKQERDSYTLGEYQNIMERVKGVDKIEKIYHNKMNKLLTNKP